MQRNLIYRFKNPYFRISIPKDIRVGLGGSTGFEVSLKDVTNSEIEILCIRLKQITHQIFQQVRSGMKSLELEDMKLILKTEVKSLSIIPIMFIWEQMSSISLVDTTV